MTGERDPGVAPESPAQPGQNDAGLSESGGDEAMAAANLRREGLHKLIDRLIEAHEHLEPIPGESEYFSRSANMPDRRLPFDLQILERLLMSTDAETVAKLEAQFGPNGNGNHSKSSDPA